MSQLRSRWLPMALLFAELCGSLNAVDGVVLINQSTALAGNVTPGDTPGFPVTISQSGSYRLSGNLTVPDADTTAILITASDVTIDLNGFSIIGPVACKGTTVVCNPFGGSGNGVLSTTGRNITVVNGTVRGMGSVGINLNGAISYVEKVHADSNGAVGIQVNFGVVTNNMATSNGIYGIVLGDGGQHPSSGILSGNNVVGNASWGFLVSCPAVLTGNSALYNDASSLFPKSVVTSGSGCVFTGNSLP